MTNYKHVKASIFLSHVQWKRNGFIVCYTIRSIFRGQLPSLWMVWRRRRLSKYLHWRVHHSFASGLQGNWCLLKSFSCKQCGGTSWKFRPRELFVANDHRHHGFIFKGKACQLTFKRNQKPSHVTHMEATRNLIEGLGEILGILSEPRLSLFSSNEVGSFWLPKARVNVPDNK